MSLGYSTMDLSLASRCKRNLKSSNDPVKLDPLATPLRFAARKEPTTGNNLTLREPSKHQPPATASIVEVVAMGNPSTGHSKMHRGRTRSWPSAAYVDRDRKARIIRKLKAIIRIMALRTSAPRGLGKFSQEIFVLLRPSATEESLDIRLRNACFGVLEAHLGAFCLSVGYRTGAAHCRPQKSLRQLRSIG